VADAISNRRTTVTNDLKKVVMSKWEEKHSLLTIIVQQSISH
jgi:hypothetical protein